jgi:hypothetical protein
MNGLWPEYDSWQDFLADAFKEDEFDQIPEFAFLKVPESIPEDEVDAWVEANKPRAKQVVLFTVERDGPRDRQQTRSSLTLDLGDRPGF